MNGLERCFRRVREADELRFSHPGRAVAGARAACEAAAAAEQDPLDPHPWHRLQAEAWAVLGSAYRAVGDLARAETALNVAIGFYDRLPGDAIEEQDWARLAQRASYLRCSQRRYGEALDLNTDALRIFERLDLPQKAAGARVDRALIVGRRGDPAAAVGLLLGCLEELDPDGDPRLYLAAVHNLAYYQLQTARTPQEEREALRRLEAARKRHEQHPEPLSLVQLQAMAGVTAVRFGRRRQGIEALWQAYRSFGEMRALPEQTLTLLHLADCAVTDGDDDEILRIAGLFFPLLGRLQLPTVTRAVLVRFLSAARSRSVTRDMVAQMTEKLREVIG